MADDLTVNSLDIDRSNLTAYIAKILQFNARQYTTPQAFFRQHLYFFQTPPRPEWANKPGSGSFNKERYLADAVQKFDQVSQEDWDEAGLKFKMLTIALGVHQQHGKFWGDNLAFVKKDISGILRTILVAGNSGPTMVDTMVLLGREVTLKRMAAAAPVDLAVHE